MAAVHGGPVAWRCPADTPAELRYLGRKCAGELLNRMALGGLTVAMQEWRFGDQADLLVRVDVPALGLPPIITIQAPAREAEQPRVIPRPDLWVPRGFVVYPASAAAPTGWGLPVLQDGTDLLAAENLKPGLDTERWTPGGALGQVLLTTVVDAGFTSTAPGRTTVPLLYDPDRPPRLPPNADGVVRVALPPPTATWSGYRIEFEAPRAQSPLAGQVDRADIAAVKDELWRLTIDHRLGLGLDGLTPPIRGYGDSAQLTCEVMHATASYGHYNPVYWPGAKTPTDRMGRDGAPRGVVPADADSRNTQTFGGENLVLTFTGTPTVLGTDPYIGQILTDVQPGPDLSATDAFDAWLDSPPHRANIESADYNVQAGQATTLLVGARDNYAAQHFVSRDHWIACGNRTWRSRFEEVPALSWFGFASLNLGFETWPCRWPPATDGSGSFPIATAPTNPTDWGTFQRGLSLLSNGAYWFSYCLSGPGAPDTFGRFVPALDSRIFCRGRCIAYAPGGGFVWAAAIQRIEPPSEDSPGRYRLVALVHHDDDQDLSLQGWSFDMTRRLRVWWCDLEGIDGLGANPELLVRGVYGEEDEGNDWDRENNPWSWRGGDLVDVSGVLGNPAARTAKYNSQWVFNSTGTQATCLRDSGNYTINRVFGGGFVSVWTTVSYGVTLDLAFEDDVLSAAVTLDPAPAGATLREDEAFVDPAISYPDNSFPWSATEMPIAVEYDDADQPIYALAGRVFCPAYAQQGWYYHGWGGYDDTRTVLDGLTYHGRTRRQKGAGGLFGTDVDLPNAVVPAILSVRERVAIVHGGAQRFIDNDPTPELPVVGIRNPFLEYCWLETESPVRAVRIYRDGEQIHAAWYGNAGGIVPDRRMCCYTAVVPVTGTIFVTPPVKGMHVCDQILPFHASDGTDWITGYLVQPQPLACDIGGDDYGPDLVQTCSPAECDPLVFWPHPTLGPVIPELGVPDDVLPEAIGGFAVASFADAAELAALTGTPGDARLLYARSV